MELENEADMLVAECSELLATKCMHIFISNAKRSGIGSVEGSKDLQQGGFSCTRSADNGGDVSFLNVQIDSLQDLQ